MPNVATDSETGVTHAHDALLSVTAYKRLTETTNDGSRNGGVLHFIYCATLTAYSIQV